MNSINRVIIRIKGRILCLFIFFLFKFMLVSSKHVSQSVTSPVTHESICNVPGDSPGDLPVVIRVVKIVRISGVAVVISVSGITEIVSITGITVILYISRIIVVHIVVRIVPAGIV